MQPRESIKTISYLGKSVSRNTRRQTKGLARGFIYRSSESPPRDPYVSVEEDWVAQQEPTPSRVSFNFFPHSTRSCLFPCGGKVYLNFLIAQHNLGSSRTMPSHLGGFTSKSNKCFTSALWGFTYNIFMLAPQWASTVVVYDNDLE
jgi:hypothetical protein